jgi:6-phosphogluconolactonase
VTADEVIEHFSLKPLSITCMKYLYLIPFLAMASTALGQQKDKLYNLIIGTYTQPGKSEGIYVYTFNPATGELKAKSKATGVKNPSFVTISHDRKHVYAANETSDGTVSAFSFDSKSGELKFLNSAPSGGNGPCYVSTDDRGKFVFVGNYGGGTLSAIPIKSDGSLGTHVQTITHEGKSVKSNQEKPHVHAAVLSKDDRFLYVPDLGTDKVNIYSVNYSKEDPLSAVTFASVEPGSGPRHFTFDPSGRNAYLIQEMTGVVTAYTHQSGKLITKQSLALPPSGFSGKVDAADIHVSPDGKFLYASLRGDLNEIVIMSIDHTGLLTYTGRQSTLGKTPRNFAIDPTGNFLLVANQNSDDIIVFKRDQKTGALHPTETKLSVGAPVCLLFTPQS